MDWEEGGRCEDKVALVTGAAGQGMGRSIALTLAREGAHVVVNYRQSADSAEAIVRAIEERGGRAVPVQADVFQAGDCEKLVKTTIGAYDHIDICIVGPGGGWHPDPVDELDAAAALEDIRRELAPLYHLMALVLPGMYERGWGRFIAIALAPPYDSPAYAYNVGKAARTQALMLAADEAWQRNVTVNVLGPGPVPGIESLAGAVEQAEHGSGWQKRGTASPQDIAEGVAFLCSDAGRFVSGTMLRYMHH